MLGITGTLLAAGIYGASQLKIDFNMDKLLAIEEGSYQDQFLEAEKLLQKQSQAAIFMGKLNFSSQMDKITSLVDDLNALDSVDVAFDMSVFSAASASFFNISKETGEIEASMIPFQYVKPQTTSEGMALMDKMDRLVEAKVTPICLFDFHFHL